MARVNLVDKKVQMTLADIIKYQIITHAHIHDVTLSDLDLECLTNLSIQGEADLTEFCELMAEKRLQERLKKWDPNSKSKKPEASPQTIRNVIIKMEKAGLIYKDGKGRKRISVNPDLKIQSEGNILLNYKMYRVESAES